MVPRPFPFLLALFLCLAPLCRTQECTADGTLCDKHEKCSVWAQDGECIRNTQYMKTHCPAACTSLKEVVCEDVHPHCSQWAELGECEENAAEMHKYCQEACGVCDVSEAETDDADCKNEHNLCSFWAENGECESNPTYVRKMCDDCCVDDDKSQNTDSQLIHT